MVDAGFASSTLHIFAWQPVSAIVFLNNLSPALQRSLDVSGMSTTFPRIKKAVSRDFSPGIVDAAQNEDSLVAYLVRMIYYAKTILEAQESVWNSIPLYLIAGGK